MPAEQVRTGAVVAIGAPALLAGYALAGVRLIAAGTPEEVRAAWQGIGDDVALVVLTDAAATAVGGELHRGRGPLTAVMSS